MALLASFWAWLMVTTAPPPDEPQPEGRLGIPLVNEPIVG